MSRTAWIIFIIITIGILVLLVVLSRSDKIDISKVDINAVQTANKQNGNIADHVFGKVGSKVTLIEYADYQCPVCVEFYPIIKAMTEKYKGQLQYVFRNYILPYHSNAKAASATVEAAGLQKKYWEMHNKVFESQPDWSELDGSERDKLFMTYAKDLGLDKEKFSTDLLSTSILNKIDYDYELGKKAGIKGTPSFFLNGKLLDGNEWSDKAKLESAIETELKKANIALPE